MSKQSTKPAHRRARVVEPLEPRQLLSGSGLAAAYFARTNLTAAKFSEIDSTVDFDWSGGTPSSKLGTDGFSTRWVGRVEPHYSETYNFIANFTGGVRLWVNDQLIIDDFSGKDSLTSDTGSIKLTAGVRYDIRLDYWSDGNDPQVQLQWHSARQALQDVPSNRLYAAVLDTKAPTTPTHLRGSLDGSAADLTWDASSDSSGIVGYDIYVNSTKVATTDPGATSYVRSGLAAGTDYTFSVQAVDPAGNVSGTATTALVTSANSDAPPTTPTNLHVTGSSLGTISLAWTASKDDKGVTGYRIYRNGVKLGSAVTGTSFTDTGLSSNTKYTYQVRAADTAGQFSGFSSAVSGTTGSNQAPSTPTNLHVTGTTQNSVSLAWNASSDDVGVSGYQIFRNGSQVGTTSGTTYTDSGLSQGTTYTYAVLAFDGSNAKSSQSSSAQGTTSSVPTINPFNGITASSFSDSSGVSTSGSDVTSIDSNDWIKFSNVNFSSTAQSFKINLNTTTASNSGGTIEIHLDSTSGTVYGTLKIQNTGGSFFTQQTDLGTNISGTHDLYLVFRNGSNMASVRSVTFSTTHLVKVMPLGDSITQGINSTTPNYRYYLYQDLMNAGKSNFDFVGSEDQPSDGSNSPNLNFDQDNEGHTGWTTSQIESLVSPGNGSNPIAIYKPDIVLLHIGTNDIIQGLSESSAISNIGTIIDEIRQVDPGVKIILAKIIPIAMNNFSLESQVDQMNSDIAGLGSSKSVTVVDMNSNYPSGAFQSDGIHPDSNGDQFIANQWDSALASLL